MCGSYVCTYACGEGTCLLVQVVTHYLVKWKSLPYEESTWELLEDIDPMKVQAYHSILDPPRSMMEVRK